MSVSSLQSLQATLTQLSLWLICFLPTCIEGHGRLIEPPARSSMWRFGFETPINYDDNALYCGGFDRQWNHNGGRCGMCGDPFDGPRQHEAGGRYARGVISKSYRQGQTIRVSVELTRSHLGWFEFRLCPNNNPNKRVTHACLNSNLLRLQDGSTRYHVRSWATKVHQVSLRLPPHVSCSQCVLQWKYNAGNSWGCTGHNTGCCMGCGHQEQFYGCADVTIRRASHGSNSNFYNNMFNNNNNNDGIGKQAPSRHIPLQSSSHVNIRNNINDNNINNNININNNDNPSSNSGNGRNSELIVGYKPINFWTNGNQVSSGLSNNKNINNNSNNNNENNNNSGNSITKGNSNSRFFDFILG